MMERRFFAMKRLKVLLFVLGVLMASPMGVCWPADVKITDLTEETAPVSTDILIMVDDPSGSPATRKVKSAIC
jgi:hypothetical protein